MIKPRLVALKSALDLPQAGRAGELTVGERRKLRAHRQRPHSLVASMLLHKPVECTPGKVLQQSVQHAILMPHGIVLSVSRSS